jgi:hypothetical protein
MSKVVSIFIVIYHHLRKLVVYQSGVSTEATGHWASMSEQKMADITTIEKN